MSDWQQDAACRDIGDQFFPESNESERQVALVKKICAGCDVIDSCAMAGRNEEFGIWGGLTAKERSRLRARAA